MSNEEPSKGELYRNKIRELRNKGLIDFTNKDNYASVLHQLIRDLNNGKDEKKEYISAFKAMKQVAKEGNIDVGSETKTTSASDKGINVNVKAKPISSMQLKDKLDNELTKMKVETEQRNIIMQSEDFKLYVNSYHQSFLSVREFLSSFNIPVAPEERYQGVAVMTAHYALKNNFVMPKWLEMLTNSLFFVSLAGLFVSPLIPKLMEMLGDGKNAIKKSEKPLAPLPNQDNESNTTS